MPALSALSFCMNVENDETKESLFSTKADSNRLHAKPFFFPLWPYYGLVLPYPLLCYSSHLKDTRHETRNMESEVLTKMCHQSCIASHQDLSNLLASHEMYMVPLHAPSDIPTSKKTSSAFDLVSTSMCYHPKSGSVCNVVNAIERDSQPASFRHTFAPFSICLIKTLDMPSPLYFSLKHLTTVMFHFGV